MNYSNYSKLNSFLHQKNTSPRLFKVTFSSPDRWRSWRSLWKRSCKTHHPQKGHPKELPDLRHPETFVAKRDAPFVTKKNTKCIQMSSTWRIIPFSKWLITMVNKSPKWDCFPKKNAPPQRANKWGLLTTY